MNWNLLTCAIRPHVRYAPAEPEVRRQLRADTVAGQAWQCLRCATFVPGPAELAGPAADAPRVRRDGEIRSALILRVFAVERFARALVFGFIAYGIWRFKYSRQSIERTFHRDYPEIRDLLHELGYNVNSSGGLVGLIQHTFALDQRTLTWLALAAAGYAALEIVEGVGLWLLRRWGEYFAMVVTSVFIPYESYELVAKVTPLRLVAFVINVVLVIYLVLSKRLFGVRGGKAAYEARLRSESVMQAAVTAAGEASRSEARHSEARHSEAVSPPSQRSAGGSGREGVPPG